MDMNTDLKERKKQAIERYDFIYDLALERNDYRTALKAQEQLETVLNLRDKSNNTEQNITITIQGASERK